MRGRFAPSPTGDLHLGNARTALLAWLQARSAGGRFVLRVEDLDPGRTRAEYRQSQPAELRWLGLEWDEGPEIGGPYAPYLQSERGPSYQKALAYLAAKGLVYECRCTRREIAAAASAPHLIDDEGPVYPGFCRPEEPKELRLGGTSAALRFRVPPDRLVLVRDSVQGERTFRGSDIGDFVVRRKDGVAAYQLAVAADDAAMKISDVLRGADLLPSAARQILLYESLDLQPPRWAHVPLVLGSDGERLSKRNGAVSLRELRDSGARPEAVVGWLAASCGLLGPGEEVRPRDLLSGFDLANVPRTSSELPSLPPPPR